MMLPLHSFTRPVGLDMLRACHPVVACSRRGCQTCSFPGFTGSEAEKDPSPFLSHTYLNQLSFVCRRDTLPSNIARAGENENQSEPSQDCTPEAFLLRLSKVSNVADPNSTSYCLRPNAAPCRSLSCHMLSPRRNYLISPNTFGRPCNPTVGPNLLYDSCMKYARRTAHHIGLRC